MLWNWLHDHVITTVWVGGSTVAAVLVHFVR